MRSLFCISETTPVRAVRVCLTFFRITITIMNALESFFQTGSLFRLWFRKSRAEHGGIKFSSNELIPLLKFANIFTSHVTISQRFLWQSIIRRALQFLRLCWDSGRVDLPFTDPAQSKNVRVGVPEESDISRLLILFTNLKWEECCPTSTFLHVKIAGITYLNEEPKKLA